jgi:Na+-transporting methylmalonyl-CoA/oxaloacetate decarboxylase gamma subunit
MGEWSEYFEDFPEENQANYVGQQFNPVAAKVQRDAQQKAAQKLRSEQQRLDAEIAAIVHKHKTTG